MIDISKMREKLEQLKNKGAATGTVKYFKPADGKQDIRVLPTKDGDPFKQFWFHYNVGPRGFMCPKRNFGDSCPVCEFARKLFQDGDEVSTSMAKDIMAKQRFMSAILSRSDDVPTVKIYTYSKIVYEEFLDMVLDPEVGDVTDPESGYDITLEYGKAPGARYASTKIKAKRTTSPMVGKDVDAEAILNEVPDFDTLNERLSTEEVQEILDKHLSDGDSDGSGDSGDVQKYGSNSEESAVDRAFEELAAS